MLLNIIIIVVALAIGGYLAFSKRLAASSNWKATVTPLASIMGSGFLVSAPLLAGIVGNLAIFCMAVLLVLAYLVGGAIRFNIRHFEPIEGKGHGWFQKVAVVSRVVLTGAYFITVTYYLQLLAAFVLRMIGAQSHLTAEIITTTLLLMIGGIGMWRGLQELESVEKYAVALNLGMIGALIVGLAVYNVQRFYGGTWTLPSVSSDINFHDFRVLLGLLVIVQGFETSRYLGDEHPADRRIKTMRIAQLVATVVYLVFIALATVVFRDDLDGNVTGIITMARPVAAVLPFLIAIAAIGSQFSASVADNEGAGGLIEDITEHRIRQRRAYLIILAVTVILTWITNVNEIISYASRAFALYYALQCLVACLIAWQNRDLRKPGRLITFAALAVVCFAIFIFGIPSG